MDFKTKTINKMEIKFTNRKGQIVSATLIREYVYKKTGKTYFYVKTENGSKRLVNIEKVIKNEI
jgi:hypothetical protein